MHRNYVSIDEYHFGITLFANVVLSEEHIEGKRGERFCRELCPKTF